MKNFRNNSWAFLLMFSFIICVSFVNHSAPINPYYNYAAIADTAKQPKMTVEEIMVQPMTVLIIRDTAATMNDIGPVLGKNYGEIIAFMQKNGLQFASQPMAWYHSQSAPFIMEAGIPVDKKPGAAEGRIAVKQTEAGKAVVVHFWGPYEQTMMAYDKIKDWLTKNNKKAKGTAYDVYITDPTTVNDPYQVQTDIIQLYQ